MERFRQNLAYIIYKPCSENDLELIPCHKNTFYKIHIFNLFDIGLVVILQNKPKPRRTVCDSKNVVSSSCKSDEVASYVFIAFSFFRIHFLIPPVFILSL